MREQMNEINQNISRAVIKFWKTRDMQAEKQKVSGRSDRGARSSVTGGAQMDGFIGFLADLICEAGIGKENIFRKKSIDLPGFFRPTKEWDLLVIIEKQLVVALEAKSQVGPSFGNNFNNRTEEAMGSALDFWTAYREGAFNKTIRPWLGYLVLLESCEASHAPVAVREPHFKVFPEFVGASYAKRYELFCRKLVRERHYNASALLMSERDKGLKGIYNEPAEDLAFEIFARSLFAHASAYAKR